MYETNGILNKKTGEELLKVSPRRWVRAFAKIYIIFCLSISAIQIFLWILSSRKEFLIYGARFISIALLMVFVYGMFLGKSKVLYINSIKEVSENGEYEFKSIFTENGVNISNLTTSANYEIKYESFYRLEETPSMYVLFTKYAQYVLVFKSCLSDDEIKSFKGFIKGKCKNIK